MICMHGSVPLSCMTNLLSFIVDLFQPEYNLQRCEAREYSAEGTVC